MSYRLSGKELRIIEKTKREGENPAVDPHGDGDASCGNSTGTKIKPYIFFVIVMFIIAIAVKFLLYFTA